MQGYTEMQMDTDLKTTQLIFYKELLSLAELIKEYLKTTQLIFY